MSSPFNSEPSPEKLGGKSLGRIVARYFAATRPMFLTASTLPVLAGSAWGWWAQGSLDLPVFMTALLAVALVHAAVNVANDVADARSGTDDRNAGRIHPFTGGSRFIQNDVLSQAQMARWAALLLAAGIAVGLFLVYFKGLWVLAFGVAGIGLGLAYSLPPLRLSARGLGEVAVALGFGVLPFSGAYWLQAGTIAAEALLLSLPISLWVMAVLVMNEVPDRNADAATGKRTLVVRLGLGRTAWLYAALQVAAFFMLLLAALAGVLPLAGLILPLLLLIPAAWTARALSGPREHLLPAILRTLAIHALGTLWLAGLAFAGA
jgi:1,4-dihydroxy-2-naphthoate octaprenyltransferase